MAVHALEADDLAMAERIFKDVESEDKERVREILSLLEHEDRTEYWEFTDRGVNFAYLEPHLRKHLATIASELDLA